MVSLVASFTSHSAALLPPMIRARRLIPSTYAATLISAGLGESEASALARALESACHSVGHQPGAIHRLNLGAEPITSSETPGALGRVVVVAGCGEELADELQMAFASQIDKELAEGPLEAPVVAYFHPTVVPPVAGSCWSREHLGMALSRFIEEYSLTDEVLPMPGAAAAPTAPVPAVTAPAVPTAFVELDGAMDQPALDGAGRWDCSAVAVFDGLVGESLRRELLKLLARPDGSWDPSAGPDPAVWREGGLGDAPLAPHELVVGTTGDAEEEEGGGGGARKSVGLCPEALDFLCASPPQSGALAAAERVFKERIFPGFRVGRMPEALLGDGVTPLTANAPRAGEHFDLHVDADPFVAPPSPWTDVFGRFRNRCPGGRCRARGEGWVGGWGRSLALRVVSVPWWPNASFACREVPPP